MNLSLRELRLKTILGGLLWTLSAILTAHLFLSFSLGNLWRMAVLVLMALGLEGSKILTWKMGGSARILSWVLIGLSILASFGSALQTVKALDQVVDGHLTIQESVADQKALLEVQIKDLEDRIRGLPPQWLTWYQRLSKDLEGLQEKYKNLENSMVQPVSEEDSSPTPGMFHELSGFFGWNRSALELVVLMILAVALEWSALILTSGKSPEEVKTPKNRVMDDQLKEKFLKLMISLGDGKVLGGRDRVGKALGLTPYQSKRYFDLLTQEGLIRREGLKSFLNGPN